MRQFTANTLAAVAASVLAVGVAPASHAAAASGWHPPLVQSLHAAQPASVLTAKRDYCDPDNSNSVTVVVDYRGSIDIQCSSGATGKQALSNAFSVSEVSAQPGFICQINGRPAGDCADTPPTTAYWSYWQAAPGGGWTYASRGYTSSRVKPGGFEGWSFGAGGPPGIDPVLPAPPEPEPEPEPEPVPEPPPAPEQPAAPEAPAPEAPSPEAPAAEAPAPNAPAPDVPGDQGDPGGADNADPGPTGLDGGATAADTAAPGTDDESAVESAGTEPPPDAAASAPGTTPESAVQESETSVTTSPGESESSVATSSGDPDTVASGEDTGSGTTGWLSIAAIATLAALGTAAVVVSRRRRSAG